MRPAKPAQQQESGTAKSKTKTTQPNAENSKQKNNTELKTDQPEEDDVISKEALDKFKSLAGLQIAKRIKVTCEGKPHSIELVSVEKAPRHPFVLRLNFKFKLPELETVQFGIIDENFREQTGAVRYALKGNKNTMLLNSNVAPIVVRAKRVELKGLSVKEVTLKTSISAKLAIMSISK